MHDRELTEAICALTCAVREIGEQLVNENKLILHRIETKVDKIMSAITNSADKVDANFGKIQDGITALDKQIQDFQNSPGTLPQADQDRLDKIVAASGALAAAANAPVTPPVPPV